MKRKDATGRFNRCHRFLRENNEQNNENSLLHTGCVLCVSCHLQVRVCVSACLHDDVYLGLLFILIMVVHHLVSLVS